MDEDMLIGLICVGEAFRCFDRWRKDHDPEGNMDVLEQAMAYSVWAKTNSIEPYLDINTTR